MSSTVIAARRPTSATATPQVMYTGQVAPMSPFRMATMSITWWTVICTTRTMATATTIVQ
ncbi:hypothetical protein [Pseudomonas brassicacearum]|uniref:hypothetical protein n=1 Tax=Pseudomonas brassicacearum TaxID=930166 RepID=UPI00129573F8|nr:hypothetical protein [Pseudomonas brassicacearum]QGA49545.1 hypothetical protein GFU70_10530 [Pseudomonas brassicacearum]